MKKHVKYFEKNEKGRDFVVGDIHGCLAELKQALTNVSFDENADRLFSVGDIADRGPNSYECLQLLFEPWFFAVKGNHEIMLFDAHKQKEKCHKLAFLQNGGEFIEKDDPNYKKIIDKIVEMPYIIELESKTGKKVGILHAEVPPNITDWEILKKKVSNSDSINSDLNLFNRNNDLEILVWGNHRISKYRRQQNKGRVYPKIKGIDLIYVGHTIVPDPILYEQHYYIDCGCYLPYWVSESKIKTYKRSGYNPRLVLMEIV